jgi:hypothetical protein
MITKDTFSLLNAFARQIYDRDLAYIEKQGYFLLDRVGGEINFISLDGTTTLYPGEEKKFPKYYILSERKSIAELSRNAVGTLSLPVRNNVATPSALVGEITKSQKKLAEKYNLPDFSENLGGQQKKDAELTYSLILEALERAVRQKKSRTKIINEFYYPALSAIENGDFLELENIKDETIKHLGKQNRALEARQVSRAQYQIWQKVKKRITIITIIFLVSSFSFSFSFLFSRHRRAQKTQQTYFFTPTQIDSLITIYETKSNQKVYQWRRKKIKENLTKPFTKYELFSMCNPKYKFK